MFTAYHACIRFTIYLRHVATISAEWYHASSSKQRIHTLYARLHAQSGPEGYSRSLGSASLPPLTYHVTFIKVRVCLCQPKCKYLDIADLAERTIAATSMQTKAEQLLLDSCLFVYGCVQANVLYASVGKPHALLRELPPQDLIYSAGLIDYLQPRSIVQVCVSTSACIIWSLVAFASAMLDC